jgi:organic radical activating enzyme
MINPESFCIGPWAEVRINTDGSMNFCHAADQTMIPASDNMVNFSIDEYFSQSTSVKSCRKDLINGQFINRCHVCMDNEKNGLLSNRQRRNLQAAIFPGKDFLPSVDENLSRVLSWKKPRFYHISLSNLCNLACMMCDPQWSSLLTSTQRKAGILTSKTPLLRDWTQDATIWNKFSQHILDNKEIVCLHFMGGEPFYHKKFIDLLDVLIDNNHCDFTLSIVTNGSIYDGEIIAKIAKFANVIIEISVESLDPSNDYIRYPSKIDVTQKNIECFLSHRSDKISVVLRSVPQFLSMTRYVKLLEFARHNKVMIDSNFLQSPSFMSVNLLPENIKKNVIKDLEKFIVHQDPSVIDINLRNVIDIDRSLSQHAQRIINQINIPCNNKEQQWKLLIDYCRKMDVVRKINVMDFIPDLADFFNTADYHDQS